MSERRLLVAGALVAIGAAALAPGCLDATQVTIDVRYARTTCTELRGTSVSVGVDPADTEDRVKKGFVNGSTTDCDAEGRIGTLVVTPGDAGRASIVVVVASKTVGDPTKCPPPDYKGCIVARRTFAFVDHEGLYLPVTITPDCLDVPCDAFSTCREGKCFRSDVACSGGSCGEPGALADGGTAVDSGYVPDTGVPVPPPPPGPVDGGGADADAEADAPTDAPSDGAGRVDGGTAFCDINGVLQCPQESMQCPLNNACCLSVASGPYCAMGCQAGESRLCCKASDCGGVGMCTASQQVGNIPAGGNAPGTCK